MKLKTYCVLWWNQFHASNYWEYFQVKQKNKFWFRSFYELFVCNYHSHCYNELINCYKVFQCFYCVDKVELLLVGFRFSSFFELLPDFICGNDPRSLANNFLGVKIRIQCLLLFFIHHLPVVSRVLNQQVLLFHHLLLLYYLILLL